MKEKLTAVVLGGTNPHIELIKQLQKRNYFVILVDYLQHPPARDYADLHLRASTMDQEAVLNIAKEYKADLVISACVDQANITACYVAERLGLTKPYNYETALNITNKGKMKDVMLKHDIPTTKYIYLESGMELPELNLNFPIMVKPADSCAASGVKKAKNKTELTHFLDEAKHVSRTGRTIVEEYAQGVEVSAYCFVENHNARIIMISERISVIEGENQILKCYATITPPRITDKAIDKIKIAANKIAAAYSLNNTPLHVQAICDGDDLNIIEYAPRVGGGISYETIKDNTGFDIISATIDSYLEIKVHPEYHTVNKCSSVNIIYGIHGKFDHLEGVDELLKDGTIKSLHFHKTKGSIIDESRASSGRIAAFVTEAENEDEMFEKIALAMDRINAYDDNGKSIMRKDLYLKKSVQL